MILRFYVNMHIISYIRSFATVLASVSKLQLLECHALHHVGVVCGIKLEIVWEPESAYHHMPE